MAVKVFYPNGSWENSLAKITVHSFQIQAAVMLFAAKVSESLIMDRLRYLSNCYIMYYCNTPVLAKLPTVAVERLSLDQFTVEIGEANNDIKG